MAAACPDDETLARVAAGDAGSAQRDEVMAHVDECAPCRRGLAALRRAHASLGDDTEDDSRAPTEPRAEPAGDAPGIPALGDRIGRYVALRVIGRGGMGIVIAAHDPELDRQVAIKLVHPRVWRAASEGARSLMRLEARAMARLVHPNVVAVHDLGTVGDQLFVAMELVGGSSLDRWLAAPRPWREILAMCLEAGKGIAAAHAAGLVHRDVKPHNVLVDAHGRPRIADFGLAVLGKSVAHGEPAGTPAYMSPEQRRGGAVTAASDQYSYAVMVYEALFGERPASPPSPPPPGRAVPAYVRRALLRALAADPADRFAGMDELLAALAPRQVSRIALAGAAVALAAAAGAGVVLLGRDEPAVADRGAAQRRLAAVWSPADRGAIERTMRDAAPPLLVALDRAGAAWIAARVELARAIRAGEQPAAAAERRAACLDGQLDELRALVDALTTGADSAGAARLAITLLPPAELCLQRDVMQEPPPPAPPARHDALARALAEARAADRLGRPDALARADALVPDARALAHPPLLADVLLLRARARARAGQLADALAGYREVVPVAAVAGDPAREAAIWVELVDVMVTLGQRPADDLLTATAAALARAGNPAVLRDVHADTLARLADFGATVGP